MTSGDPAGLTLRSLAAATGASNGSIYHAFRSKEELLARLWLRASSRLGAIMADAVRRAGGGQPQEAVVALALAPIVLVQQHPASARLFFAQRSDQLFSADLAPEIVDELAVQQKLFTDLLVSLALGMWNRKDGVAVEAIAACVVDVPGGLLRRLLVADRPVDATSERRIEAAVRAILALPLDPPRKKMS